MPQVTFKEITCEMTYSRAPKGTDRCTQKDYKCTYTTAPSVRRIIMKGITVCPWRIPCEEWKCSERHTGKGKNIYLHLGLGILLSEWKNKLLQRG